MTQRHPTTFTYPPNCWHDVNNTNINTNSPTSPTQHPTITHIPPIVFNISFSLYLCIQRICVFVVQSNWYSILAYDTSNIIVPIAFQKYLYAMHMHSLLCQSSIWRKAGGGEGGLYAYCIQIPNEYYMNCKWFPVSLLIVRLQWLSWIQILNCLKCQRFHTSSQAMSCDVLVMVVVFVFDLVVFLDQDMSPHHFD